jgi:hypothetical protein
MRIRTLAATAALALAALVAMPPLEAGTIGINAT